MNYKYLVDIEVDGVDYGDYPDFSDAYIASAAYPRFGWFLGYLYNLIPHSRIGRSPVSGTLVVYPRFFKLRRFLISLIYRDLTDDELEEVNEDLNFVYEQVQHKIY